MCLKNKINSEVIKEIKPIYTISRTDLEHDGYNKGYRGWHSHRKYECNETKTRLKISDSIGGCAVQHIYGWLYNQNKEDIIEVLEYCIKDLDKGVGLVTCQVGSNFKNSKLVKGLLKLGFKNIIYSNYQHDIRGKEKGNLYILRVKH